MNSFPFRGVIERPFQIDSISPVANPNGGPGDWYQYVISQGPGSENAIRGQRCGSLVEVNAQLLEMVEQLNQRFGKLKKK